ncbi:hypothetical protein [Tenuifilum thalassicum]|uniref:DRTGG domain-containing protein n=1 Tax=Tenuifilum thalassicum TaxID=2590900 RepID=A0A7D4BSL9_9BACT|nr:hypothetical protein [Tenuifilum thalassicum]QKG80521.1 hypothetical protein FHG85_09655 [Tenuifilum thalassicum]
MKLKELADLIEGSVVCCPDGLEQDVEYAFASDLMSDVLTVSKDRLVLITGLANMQAVRTAEMADILAVVFVRGKTISQDMIRLAEENGIVLIESPYTMFRASGVLYGKGLKPVY